MSIEGKNVEKENVQDKIVEKIHKEAGLDEEDNNYNLSETQSDSNQQDAEKGQYGNIEIQYHLVLTNLANRSLSRFL